MSKFKRKRYIQKHLYKQKIINIDKYISKVTLMFKNVFERTYNLIMEEYKESIPVNKDEIKAEFIQKYNLKLNKSTGKYDCDGNINVTNEDLFDGHFPIPFGVIKGDFNCSDCTELVDLTNGPISVGGSFWLNRCNKLETLQNGPQQVGGSYMCNNMDKLTSLKGAPEKINGSFRCFSNKSLTTLQGGPKFVAVDFYCCSCPNLTSLKGAPEKVERTFDCHRTAIRNLQGAPKYVGGNFDCSNCNQLETLDGAPTEIKGVFQYNKCPKLKVFSTK